MKTAETILKENITGYRGSIKRTDAIKAMKEYAEQAIDRCAEITNQKQIIFRSELIEKILELKNKLK